MGSRKRKRKLLTSFAERLSCSHEAEEPASSNEEKKMRKLLDLLGDVMLMLCAIAGISVMELVFVYLAMELSK